MFPFDTVTIGQMLATAIALLLLVALLWWVGVRAGYIRPSSPFSASDVRSWPLSFAVLEMALTILAFTGTALYFGTSVVSASVSALLVAVVSPLLARFYR